MRVAFIGDIVGRPGRTIIKESLVELREEFNIDIVIANSENASHGYGLSMKNANELFSAGIDVMTGGNHSWDKKEVVTFIDEKPLLRPVNYPDELPGRGSLVVDVENEKLGIINIMGHFSMPLVENAFRRVKLEVNKLKEQGVDNIFIDFHAESTSEKRAMMIMLKDEVSAIIGTHTHVGTDDIIIDGRTLYISDIGLTGCRDNVIGMDAKAPIERFLTSMPERLNVPNRCKKILQIAIFDIGAGACKSAFKLKLYDNGDRVINEAYIER